MAPEQCQGIAAGVTQLDYDDLARIRGSRLLKSPPAVPEAGAGNSPDQSSAVLVAISRGVQPTSGYRLTLARAELTGLSAIVTVNWQTPAADAVVAQVLTHPCLVVGLPRGALHDLRVVDQNGTEIGQLSL
ncbi:MAG: protease complex subunit PrcB family protein [Pseudomonadales bacterium]